MGTTVQTQQLWEEIPHNRAGVCRLKLADADAFGLQQGELIPLRPVVTFYEFIFPRDLSCGLSVQRQLADTGSVFWSQSLSFMQPQLSEALVTWAQQQAQTRWLAICEDYNGRVRLLGTPERGLVLGFQGSTGNSPADRNRLAFELGSNQLAPYYTLPAYDDDVLFPEAGFSYGFSLGFNA